MKDCKSNPLVCEPIIVVEDYPAKLLAIKVAIELRINQYQADIVTLNAKSRMVKTQAELNQMKIEIAYVESFIDELQKLLILF